MRCTLAFLLSVLVIVSVAASDASTGDITMVIEHFVAEQFPSASSYFWVVNAAQWQTENEVVVDVNAVVQKKPGDIPTASRYLLLIVGDRLAASQNVPVDKNVECAPEKEV
jgi:hypothetical protein